MDVIAPAVHHRRVLVLADWRTDPHAVVAECRRRASGGAVSFALVVPAWLHGLDWAGDPHASRPCAARQLETLVRLAQAPGLEVEIAHVGDPDATSAADDARPEFAAPEIMVCRDGLHRSHPLDLPHRLRRMTGLPVEAPLIGRRATRERRRRRALLHGHCVVEAR